MKRVLVFAATVALALPVFAQNGSGGYYHPYNPQAQQQQNNPQYDTRGERNLPDKVDIVGQPQVNTSSNAAQIRWQTNNLAATDVWLTGGGINGHRTEYQRGGSRDHEVVFNNLRPHTTYTFLIRARDGVRFTGSFTTR